MFVIFAIYNIIVSFYEIFLKLSKKLFMMLRTLVTSLTTSSKNVKIKQVFFKINEFVSEVHIQFPFSFKTVEKDYISKKIKQINVKNTIREARKTSKTFWPLIIYFLCDNPNNNITVRTNRCSGIAN